MKTAKRAKDKQKKKPELSAVLTTVLFCLFTAGLFAAFLLFPDREYSENENRTLQTFPGWTASDHLDGTFGSEMNDYFADQFPMRNGWTAAKGIAELVAGKGENNGVLVGTNEQLAVYAFDACAGTEGYVPSTDGYSEKLIERECRALADMDEKLKKQGIPFCFLLAPRTIDVAASAFTYPDDGSRKLISDFYGRLPETVNAPEVIPLLREKYESGEYVAYRTDHHWTTLGAYYAYVEVMKSWGMEGEILPESAFTVSRTPNFYGTTWSKLGLPFVGPDVLELWETGDEDRYLAEDLDSGHVLPGGLYSRSFLEVKDKYAVFLDGTHNRLRITDSEGTGRETLLVAKDSFANCMIPFLARHFDIVVLNLSDGGDETNLSKYVEKYGCDRVLIVYGLENATTSYRLSGIR